MWFLRRPVAVCASLAIACACAIGWTGSAAGRENESFGMTPHPEQVGGADRGTFSIPLEPGATFEDAVRIYNRTDHQLDLMVYAADAQAAPDDTDITVGFRTDRPEGVGSWIDLARDNVTLAPRDEVIIPFRVEVRTSEPSPNLGAIVVEDTASGVSGSAAQREFLAVRTVPPNTQTASQRVQPLLLRSPWIVVAMLGLIVAIALVWIGARRAKRPKDVLVPAGEIEPAADGAPEASRPVIKRLGASETAGAAPTGVVDRTSRDDRPLLDDAFLVEVDAPASEEALEEEEEEEPAIDADLGYEEDVDADAEPDAEEDLPPARRRPVRTGAGAESRPAARTRSSTTTRSQPAKRKPARAKASAKEPARPKRRSNATRTKATSTKAGKARTKSGAKDEKRASSTGFIPLDEL